MTGNTTDGKEGNETLTKITTMSPYFLLTNDNPGNIITQVQLKDDNYDEWTRELKISLDSLMVQ